MGELKVLDINTRSMFRKWLEENSETVKECWIELKREKPSDSSFVYLDAVEEALCFGWIDSTYKKIGDKHYQRFSPRKKNSPWSELNKARAKRLIKLGLMTERGLAYLPDLDSFEHNDDIVQALKANNCYDIFLSFPVLYQRIRIGNILSKKNDLKAYNSSLENLIKYTKKNQMYGSWNDYGRLSDIEK